MKCVKTVTATAAFVLALSGNVFAQGTLGDSGVSGAVNGSAVEAAPSAVESAPSAVESAPSAVESATTGSGVSSSNSTGSTGGNPTGAETGSGAGSHVIMGNGIDGTNRPPKDNSDQPN